MTMNKLRKITAVMLCLIMALTPVTAASAKGLTAPSRFGYGIVCFAGSVFNYIVKSRNVIEYVRIKTPFYSINDSIEVHGKNGAVIDEVCYFTSDPGRSIDTGKAVSHEAVEGKNGYVIVVLTDGHVTAPKAVEFHRHKFIPDESTRIRPTCTADGEVVMRCACKASEKQVFSATGHDFRLKYIDEPSCETEGCRHEQCIRCLETRDIPVEACGHEMVAEISDATEECDPVRTVRCIRCGLIESSGPVSMFSFEKASGGVLLTEYSGKLRNVVVPREYNGEAVAGIGDNAFENHSSLESIVIPDSVTEIGEKAFSGCTSLTAIDLSNVRSIGMGAFSGCSKLASAVLSDSPGLVIGSCAFENCVSLTDITVPEDIRMRIGDDTFANAGNVIYHGPQETSGWGTLCVNGYVDTAGMVYTDSTMKTLCSCPDTETIEIPDSVISVSTAALTGCESLRILKAGKNVRNISVSLFNNLNSIECICVDPGNEKYSSTDGVLFSEDGTKLIYYPVNRAEAEYSVPEGVTEICGSAFRKASGIRILSVPDSVREIGSNAFSGCPELYSVSIGDGVTGIGSSAFMNCRSLEKVKLGGSVSFIPASAFANCPKLSELRMSDSVKEIRDNAFSRCTSLADVYYTGSPDNAEEITVSGGNDCVINARWHYTDISENT